MITYRQALRSILERADFERGDRPAYGDRVWRLDRVRELLAQLGSPQDKYPSVHITGTKGKGSTTAMIESVLRAAGCRTGMYTSPHLHTFRERIRLGGQLISEEDLCSLVERLQPILAERPEVTVFEIITALAMWYYAEQGIDIGVFEVGLGGRLDATNVLKPLVSAITSISLDHTKVLGDTLAAIAGEKAGIIKPATPVVSAPQRPEAMAVLVERAKEEGARLVRVGQDWKYTQHTVDERGQVFSAQRIEAGRAEQFADLCIPLLGEHQIENATVALGVLAQLRERGLEIPDAAIREGLATVEWPGRMQILGRRPTVMVDGAHNVYSLQTLTGAVGRQVPHRRLLLIFGAGRTHDPDHLLRALRPATDRILLTQANHPKATPVEDLLLLATDLGFDAAAAADASHALARALDEAGEDDLVLATGSLFVIAEVQRAWAARQGLPPYPSDPPGAYYL